MEESSNGSPQDSGEVSIDFDCAIKKLEKSIEVNQKQVDNARKGFLDQWSQLSEWIDGHDAGSDMEEILRSDFSETST